MCMRTVNIVVQTVLGGGGGWSGGGGASDFGSNYGSSYGGGPMRSNSGYSQRSSGPYGGGGGT